MGNLILFRSIILTVLLTFINSISLSQSKFLEKESIEKSGNVMSSFSIPNNEKNLNFIKAEGIKIKYLTEEWIYITSNLQWIQKQIKEHNISDYFLYHSKASLLADSARMQLNVDSVHNGYGNLSTSYTGEGVVIGYVDQGIDFTHPDFIDANGNTRVLRYWDHSTNVGGPLSPYGYGIVWDSTAINNGSCTSTETGTAHGTTVAGMGSGNGNANGLNKGIAPNSKIIIVESNFNLPNWDLTIADACDYIFKVADSLGLPAVVNLSLGDYIGSHDGNDPATQAIEAMLDEKPGRIVVCAAGNSGNQGKYHVNGIVDADTSFVWFLNNASSAFGANKIFFDLWSNNSDATYDFAFGADKPGPTYGLRGKTNYWTTTDSLGSVILDTIYNSVGQRIATIEAYPEIVGTNYHLQVLFSNVDSTNYLFRFMTTNSGKYDLWSGAFLGLNNIVSNIPTVMTFPPIAHYHLPDSLQTTVSGWACSEKVVTVANAKNRKGHTTKIPSLYNSDANPPGKLTVNSSKGPTRHGLIKPDITGFGDVSLTAAPMWLLSNAGYNGVIDITGWHARNGGTSMASPGIAGIAALYLEKCPKASYQDFINDLKNTAKADGFTGIVPNNAYGYGKANAQQIMETTEFTATINGPLSVCSDSATLTINASQALSTAYWNTLDSSLSINVLGGDFYADVYSYKGCLTKSDTLQITQLQVATISPIVQNGDTLSVVASDDYQWSLDGNELIGETNDTLIISAPYGLYSCTSTSIDNCEASSSISITLGLNQNNISNLLVYPNPVNDELNIKSDKEIQDILFFDQHGKTLKVNKLSNNKFDTSKLSKGIYHVEVTIDEQKINVKFVK